MLSYLKNSLYRTQKNRLKEAVCMINLIIKNQISLSKFSEKLLGCLQFL